MMKCEIHQPSFRYYLLKTFEAKCLRRYLHKHTLYLFYTYKLDLAKIQEAVADAFLDAFVNPIDEQQRNLFRAPPGELVRRVHGELLRQTSFIAYVGKTEHGEAETDGRGATTYQYKIFLRTVHRIWQGERERLDVECVTVCLQGETAVSEESLLKKYQALFVLPLSHYRARNALHILETQGVIANNGKKRVVGREILCYTPGVK